MQCNLKYNSHGPWLETTGSESFHFCNAYRTWISFHACFFFVSLLSNETLLAHLKDMCHIQCKLGQSLHGTDAPTFWLRFSQLGKVTANLHMLCEQGKSANQLPVCALALRILIKRMCKWPLVSFLKDCISKEELLLEPLQCMYTYDVSLKINAWGC